MICIQCLKEKKLCSYEDYNIFVDAGFCDKNCLLGYFDQLPGRNRRASFLAAHVHQGNDEIAYSLRDFLTANKELVGVRVIDRVLGDLREYDLAEEIERKMQS